MTTMRFNPLTYANRLKETGMDSRQAETLAQLQEEIIESFDITSLATKSDIKDLKTEIIDLKKDMITLRDLMHYNTWKIIGLLATLQTILHFFPK